MSDETNSESAVREGSRIAKVMARAGLCSRREAETWIAAGRVTVNGKVLESPAYNVTDEDDVRVDGQRLAAPERTRLFLFHKVRGLVTTARDPEGRPTIFDALPPDLPRLVAVGRLDINTEGLMLLSNDGGLARVLELPSTGWLRRYRVRAHGHIDQPQLDALSNGITIDGIDYAGIEARLDREQGSNAWITMGLREGKNREIKRVLEHLGLSVNRLIRVSFGPFELGDLNEGEVAEVRTRVLRDQLGAKLAKEAGADFDAPLAERAPPVEAPREERRRRPEGRKASFGKPTFDKSSFDRNRDEAPRRGPPAPSTAVRKRKHVTALRAEIAKDAADAAAPRKRIARGATQDRKGRTVAVERISKAGAEAAEPGSAGKRGSRKLGPRRGRPPGHSPGVEGGREFPERPRRPDPFEVKRGRNGEGRDRPSRAGPREGDPRADFKPRGARKDRDDRGPRASRPPRTEGGDTRPARRPAREGDARTASKPYGARKEWDDRGPRAPRPPRTEGGDARPARRPRREGDARTASKPYGARKQWDDRGPRSPRAEGDQTRPPRRSTRDDSPRGGAASGPPGGRGGKPGGRPPKGAGPRRPPPKR
ncbi:pseudouridine synthase [Roseiarcus sp.]|uniref:pseudouridine synthase n=1 Tax=Roseiarcus sp. TaxID=1969460 RepID=UPI003F9D153A